jgi:hypothetical protein
MQFETRPIVFYGLWLLTFLGMPIGGGLARLIVGPADTVVRSLLAGALAGAVIGLAQWLMLRQVRPIGPVWIAATAAGLGLGFALAQALVGNSMGATEVALRGLICGAVIAALQWLASRDVVPNAWIWSVAVFIGWPLAWTITRAIGVDLSQNWVVFGASGAIVFAIITAVALGVMTRLSVQIR